MKQKIGPLTQNEKVWLANQLEGAARFVGSFYSPGAGQTLTPLALDKSLAAWMGSGSAGDTESVNAIINSVGVAFGQLLVDGLGMTWVIATDEQGSDLAVYGLPGTGDVLIYPTNFVAKRWERAETNFLQDSYQQIARQVQALSHEPSS